VVWRGEDAAAISRTKGQELANGWVLPLPSGEIATLRRPYGRLVRNDSWGVSASAGMIE
jgi:hypothetical protein